MKKIFVTVGTGKFDLLISEIDKVAINLGKNIEFVAQIGNGNYTPKSKNIKWFRFKVPLSKFFSEADLIISHGGAGTTYELLGRGKKLIGVANLARTDEHQQDILRALSDEGYLIWCKNIMDIEKCITLAFSGKAKFKKYPQQRCEIADKIVEFLNKKD